MVLRPTQKFKLFPYATLFRSLAEPEPHVARLSEGAEIHNVLRIKNKNVEFVVLSFIRHPHQPVGLVGSSQQVEMGMDGGFPTWLERAESHFEQTSLRLLKCQT